MKKIYTLFLLGALACSSFLACSKSDDYDKYLELQELEKQRIEAQIALQKPILEKYAAENFNNAKLDSATGIWYEVLAPGNSESYSYSYNSVEGILFPNIKVAFKGQLIDGTTFEESTAGSFKIFGLKSRILAWKHAFFPQKIGELKIGGLTEQGLKKGSKIRFITYSVLGYDNATTVDKVPANSPLVYTIEVLEITNDQINVTQ
ncbi:FKBP-type peptidyl-prolyl cis-trans isomerase [Sphingobacteriaceae bacterium WQ 2009]|uniref:Peptidyl-prolyl cis-trans isomerase n=1 Tax=Rhinopithecimicrobium faecis TaxID=2820698 RepID=A0A8T4H7W5_9SPHI|nr:FKBP-type peptidyl-prolyl cis-trans isomerase [Sphingobacteriaceae bacterium WQ 2009]